MEKTFQQFNKALEAWYKKNQRSFPWRSSSDPYKIWISEIMSQQTQITRVATTFYPRFLEKYPDIETLAKAEWDDVFLVWDGLGYYSRGKNALKTAKLLYKKYNNQFPTTTKELESLPGIGKYTAAAIRSFAFDEKIPAIDTNISKIIGTLFPKKPLIETAQFLVQNARSGKDWNSAMMDLASFLREGKTIDGTLGEKFFPKDVAAQFLPQRKKSGKKPPKKNVRRIEVGIACIWQDGKYLVQARPKGKSFAGFWEFPGGKREKGESFRHCVKREVLEEINVNVSVRPHFYEELCQFENAELLLRFHRAQIQSGTLKPLEKQKIDWIAPEKFFSRKFLKTNHKALRKLQKIRV